MADMLAKLYDLPLNFDPVTEAAGKGVIIRKPIGPEKHLIVDWVREHFSDAWASEFDLSMGRIPPTSWIATKDKELIGFACYDATGLGLFGPMGVREDRRGRGLGRALLLAGLTEMKLRGYAYAVIGSVGPAAFYEKCCGAVAIPASSPSIWYDMLRRDKPKRARPASRGRRRASRPAAVRRSRTSRGRKPRR
jgi:GNAT superfamily N-acetyltransferase